MKVGRSGEKLNFSVILPTYNRDRILPRAIRSVLAQTHENFELIIVDDASVDDTSTVIEQFTDSRIRYCARQENGGAAAARNSGLRLAKGRLLSFLDDDDEYLPGFLEETFKKLNRSPASVGFSWAAHYVVNDTADGEVCIAQKHWEPKPHLSQDRYKVFLQSMQIGCGWGLTIRRECLERVGFFDESFRFGEDTEFVLRLCSFYEGLPIKKHLLKIHHHAGPNLFPNCQQTAKIYEQILHKHVEQLKRDEKLRTYFQYKTGWWHYYGHQRRAGRRYITTALKANPFNVKRWLVFMYLEIFGHLGVLAQRKLMRWIWR